MLKRPQLVFLFGAAILAASMWFYVDRILVSHQIADAVAQGRPRGNLSDLYPRWLGARELLMHRRNPYGEDIAAEIQQGYYGRVLDPSRPNDPKDRQGFAYPVYVVFLLAPLIGLPFHVVQICFYWVLFGLMAAGVWLWLHALRWNVNAIGIAAVVLLTLGSFPVVQGIKLQQLSLVVAALLAAAAASVASGLLFCGGVLLALATIKPQLAWPLVAWLLLWAVSEWRVRRSFVFGFGFAMALLLAGAEIVLPGWLPMFVAAIRQYHRYTQNQSVLDQLVNWALGRFGGQILGWAAVFSCGVVLWPTRREPATAASFGRATALVLALTVLVVPMFAPYNQVLLLPSLLLMARDGRALTLRLRGGRVAYMACAFALAWQWIATIGLTAAYWISPAWALAGWTLPLLTTFALPVLVFALTWMNVWSAQGRFARSQS